MPAPTLAEDWRSILLKPNADWIGVAIQITPEALCALGRFSVVPSHDGGLQLVVNQDGYQIEIDIGPDGRISGLYVEHGD